MGADFDNRLQNPAADARVPDTATPPADGDAAGVLFSTSFDQEIRRRWELAKDAKRTIEREMLADARRRDGEYDPEIKAKLEQFGGSQTFDNVTDVKCSGIESLLADMTIYAGDRIWSLKHTPEPDLDARVEREAVRGVVAAAMEAGVDPADAAFDEAFAQNVEAFKESIRDAIEAEAKKRAEGMERRIEDQLAEGGFREALNEFIVDFATHKVAALMGPCPQMRTVPVVRGTEVTFEEKRVLAVERVSPFHLYPESLTVKPGQGDFFVRKPISADAAAALKKIPGVHAERFEQAFRSAGKAQETIDGEVADLAQKNGTDTASKPEEDHELILWWHKASHAEIAEFSGQAPAENADPSERIPMQGMMLNGIVIKAVPNLDKTGAPTVFVASYRRRPGSFWGIGGSGLSKGKQEQVNGAARAAQNNIGMSAQPRTVSNRDMLVDPNALAKSFPGQDIQVSGTTPGDNRKAVEVIQTPNYTEQMLRARQVLSAQLDEQTGVYPQSYGSPAQNGPAETLGGYQLLRKDQSTTMKRALANVSEAIGGLIRAFWLWNMLFDEDDAIKGDFEVVASGPVQSYLTAEDADRMLAVLDLINKYPLLQSAIEPTGPAQILRQILKINRIPAKGLLKDESDLLEETQKAQAAAEEAAQAEAAAAAGGAPGAGEAEPGAAPVPVARPDRESDLIRANADLMRARTAADRLELDKERLAMERAERLAKIQKAQRELAAQRQQAFAPMGGLDFGQAPAMGGAA